MPRRSKPSDERYMTSRAAVAFAAMGYDFFDNLGEDNWGEPFRPTSFYAYTRDWHRDVANHIVETYAEACKRSAFGIECDDASGTHRGYRIFRLGAGPNGSGHLYTSETFSTFDDLANAMRLIETLAQVTR